MNNCSIANLKATVFAVVTVLSVTLISACGQKGALYLPTEEKSETGSEQTENTQSEQEQQETEK